DRDAVARLPAAADLRARNEAEDQPERPAEECRDERCDREAVRPLLLRRERGAVARLAVRLLAVRLLTIGLLSVRRARRRPGRRRAAIRRGLRWLGRRRLTARG